HGSPAGSGRHRAGRRGLAGHARRRTVRIKDARRLPARTAETGGRDMSARPVPIPAGTLVVSCQSGPTSPFRGPVLMAALARAAQAGGAAGIRADGPVYVAAIAAAVTLPIIGLNKTGDRDGVYI